MAKHIYKGDETHRRKKIIVASRAADANMLPQLLAQLNRRETYENRRHVVRSLGNIGGTRAGAKLVELLGVEQGLILGDIARSIGKLKIKSALPALSKLCTHESEWVRQCAIYALRQMKGEA